MLKNDGTIFITGYHTQEKRHNKLTEPKKCERRDAWLGCAYYFWDSLFYAEKWGVDSKKNNYEIYTADIDMNNIIDAEYNREGREFFYDCLEDVKNECCDKNMSYNTITINKLLKEKFWDRLGITGIIVADTPKDKFSYRTVPIFHKRRVQIAIFDLCAIINFQLLKN